MSLESILEHIFNESNLEREKITKAAKLEAEKIIQEGRREAGVLYKDIFEKEKTIYENQKQRLLVNARLEHKKNTLLVKQELIGAAFKKLKASLKAEKFKKEQVLTDKIKEMPEDLDFYLDRFRQDHEIEIARILFK